MHSVEFSRLDNPTKKCNYVIKVNFCGHSGFSFSGQDVKELANFEYSTIYPYNLHQKWIEFKIYKKKFFNREKLLASYQLNCHQLATGPCNYSINLTRYHSKTLKNPGKSINNGVTWKTKDVKNKISSTTSKTTSDATTQAKDGNKSNHVNKYSFNLKFYCKFQQICPNFLHILTIEKLKPEKINLFVPSNNRQYQYQYNADKNEYYLAVKVTAEDLDQAQLIIPELDYKANLDYQPANLDKFVNWAHGQQNFNHGPILRQMTPESVANELGVIYGQIWSTYPLPKTIAKSAIISIKNSSATTGKKIVNYETKVKMLHHFFNKQIHQLSETSQRLKLIKQLEIALERCRITEGLPPTNS